MMKRVLVLTTLATMLLTACVFSTAGKKDMQLPAAKLQDQAGAFINLESLRGKRVFVNLWATWCPPCVAEMPSIQSLYNKTNTNNTAFVLISLDKTFDIATQWAAQKNYTLPLYFPNGELPDDLQVSGIPATFIFDESGKLIFSQVGGDDYDKPKFIQMMSGK